jgi:hypothetical protein
VDLLKPFMGNNTLLMFAIMVIVVIVGTALDMTPTVSDAILMPIIKTRASIRLFRRAVHHQQRDRPDHAAGGVVLNVVSGFRTSAWKVIKGVWPFMIAQLVMLFLIDFPGTGDGPAKWFAARLHRNETKKRSHDGHQHHDPEWTEPEFLGFGASHLWLDDAQGIETSCRELAKFSSIHFRRSISRQAYQSDQSAHDNADAIIMNPWRIRLPRSR